MAVQSQTAPKKEVKNLKYQRDKDREMVRGKFHFYEVPGGTLMFPFKKYKEDKVEHYNLVDGQIYTIPLGVAKHLNNDCSYPQYEFVKGEEGVQTGFGSNVAAKITKRVQRTGFQSLEFMDIDDLGIPSEIVLVEKA